MRPAEALPPHDPIVSQDSQVLARLAEVGLVLRSTTDLSAMVEVISGVLHETYSADSCTVFLIDDSSGALRRWDAENNCIGEPYMPPAGGVLATVLLHEEPLYLSYPSADSPRPDPALLTEDCSSIVAQPLTIGGRLHGVLVSTLSLSRNFSSSDQVVFGYLADALATVLDRRRRARDIEGVREQIQHVESEAEERESLLGQMLSVVAHEMRTPLTAIKAYAEALLDAPDESEENRIPFLEIINEECDRLGRMLANALDYSRLESGQRSLHLTSLSLNDLIHDTVLTLKPEGEKRDVGIKFSVEDDFGAVEGDPDLLKQLCINLASNAIKFSPENTDIELAATGDENTWTLKVSDHGVGIPEDQRDKIFQRFYRVETDGRRGVPGTGLGLTIARGIAELHGGRIWVAANTGGGSTFTVELPRMQRAPTEARKVSQGLWQHPAAELFLDQAVRIISEVMEARIVSIMGVHAESGDLRVIASQGLEEHARKRRVGYRGGVAGRALADGAPILVNDIEADPRFQRPNHPQYSTKSLLCVPLVIGGQPVGVINVNNKRSREPFDEEDLALLSKLVERMATAAERIRAFPETKGLVEEGLSSMQAITRKHRELALGRWSAADYAFTLALRLGAVGKDALGLARLVEPAIEKHPNQFDIVGADTPGEANENTHLIDDIRPVPVGPAAQSNGLGERKSIILSVEEWWDGSGQPRGIRAEQIPLGARIMAVVNAFDLWTSGRPYRTALSAEDALKTIKQLSGRRFDPRVVQELGEILEEETNGEEA